MSYFDRRPNLFRLSFLLLAAVLLTLSIVNFVRYAASPTDENTFFDAPSNVYVTKSFPISGRTENASIHTGDLLVRIDGIGVAVDSASALSHLRQRDTLALIFYRPSTNLTFSAHLRPSVAPKAWYRVIPGAILCIRDVAAGGASDRAGMKIGDIILRINERTFMNAADADRMLRSGETGKVLNYEMLRENTIFNLPVVLARFGLTLYNLILWLGGLVFAVTGLFLGLKRPQLLAARLLGLANFLLGIYLMTGPVRRDIGPLAYLFTRDACVAISLLFSIVLFYQSNFHFPVPSPAMARWKWSVRVAYGIVVLMLIAGTISYNRVGINLDAADAAILIVYVLILLRVSRNDRSAESRRMGRFIRRTIIIVVAAMIAFPILFGIAGFKQPALLTGFFLMWIPFAELYTIGQNRLLDLEVRVRRNVRYTLATAAWGVVVVFALIVAYFLIPGIPYPDVSVVFTGTSFESSDAPAFLLPRVPLSQLGPILLGVGATGLLIAVRRGGQRVIDRKYFRGGYDYRKAGNELAEVLGKNLGMTDLAAGLVERLKELMSLKSAGVLFFREGVVCCSREDGVREGCEGACLAVSPAVYDALAGARDEVKVAQLPAEAEASLARSGYQYAVPVRSKERLVGALLIGEKMSENSFRSEDLEFLSIASKQASVAIENAFLYEELTEQERYRTELDLARRIQLASLPQKTPDIAGAEISGASQPALEVGGDFYDFLEAPGKRLTVVVGDVSGKGTSAALYVSKVQGILRSLHEFGLSPRALLIKANAVLRRDLMKQSFVTAVAAAFDFRKGRVTVGRAGHLPIFHFNAKRKAVEQIRPAGIGLGLRNSAQLEKELKEQTVRFSRGDVFLFFSDGVTDVRNGRGEDFGEQRLRQILLQHAGAHAPEIRAAIEDEVQRFADGVGLPDDMTLVVVRIAASRGEGGRR